MAAQADAGEPIAGFGVVDDKGRVTLSRAVRAALGLGPGSSVAFVLVEGVLVLIPQDAHLAALMERATAALDRAGITTEHLLAELDRVRDEVVRERYGDAFVDGLAHDHARTASDRGE